MNKVGLNSGNFQALLQFRVDAGDNILREHFATASSHATYRSKTTQNELISLCGDYIRDQILAEVRDAGFYSISADEATDQANHEQLTLVLRFCDKNDREEFMEFVLCHATTGEALADVILDKIKNDWKLPLSQCRGQTYDGAGNMAGPQRGTAARIKEQSPKAVYTHCANHRLNLAVVKAMPVQEARNMMDTADRLVRYYKYSPKRQNNLEKWIDEINTNETARKKLKELCRTRWVARHDAFNVFMELHEAIVHSLEDISTHAEEWNQPSVNDGRALLLAVTQFPFIAALNTVRDIIAYVQPISASLQSKTMDVIKAANQVKHAITALEEVRNDVDNFHHNLFLKITTMAQAVGTETARPRICGRQQHRANAPADDAETYYRMNLTIPVIDQLLMGLHDRFGAPQLLITNALHLVPAVIKVAPRVQVIDSVQAFATEYKDDLPIPQNFQAELHCWLTRWEAEANCDVPKDAATSLKAADNAFFPNIHTCLKLVCTFGVTSAECERTISALRRLETTCAAP